MRRKTVYILSLLCLLLFPAVVFNILSGDKAFVLIIDGQSQVFVKDKSQVDIALNKAKNELVNEYPVSINGFGNILEYDEKKIENKDTVINDEQLVTLLKEKLNWEAQSWAITINGEPVVHLASNESAEGALELVMKQYLSVDNEQVTVEDVAFEEEVQIVDAYISLKQLMTSEKAAEILTQGLFEKVQYEVKEGDSLWTIASDNNITFDELQEANPEVKDFIKVGDYINLIKSEPPLSVVYMIQKTVEESMPYTTVYEYDPSLYQGQMIVKKAGTYGSRQVTYRITEINGREKARETLAEKIMLKPQNRIVIRGTKPIEVSRGGGNIVGLEWPIRGVITSGYGYRGREFHNAIDISGVTGTPVKAAEDGVVTFAAWQGNYGNSIVLNHGNGLTTRYSHLSAMTVSVGTKARRGEIIGQVGSTGRSSGPHLDFEVRVNGLSRNPLAYLQ
ncbi:MAG: hypothetical protein APF84_01120 [Gracilibacter sp. BRH_c7a]|nr:MAG: hypothetical protein APF84_01120 [Gracilibacter sp. BRH_c7a]